MNDAHFAKVFPKNACKYGETTTKDLFTLTLLFHLPIVYKFVKKKHTYNCYFLDAVAMWEKMEGLNFGKLLLVKQIVRNILMNLMTAPLIQFLTDIN